MPTELAYRDDAYAREITARVVAASPEGVVLDRTVFYARAGGQPGDAGEQDRGGTCVRSGHAQYQAAGGNQAIVRAQHRRAQPATVVAAVRFDVRLQCVHQSSTRQNTAFRYRDSCTCASHGWSGPAPETLSTCTVRPA